MKIQTKDINDSFYLKNHIILSRDVARNVSTEIAKHKKRVQPQ